MSFIAPKRGLGDRADGQVEGSLIDGREPRGKLPRHVSRSVSQSCCQCLVGGGGLQRTRAVGMAAHPESIPCRSERVNRRPIATARFADLCWRRARNLRDAKARRDCRCAGIQHRRERRDGGRHHARSTERRDVSDSRVGPRRERFARTERMRDDRKNYDAESYWEDRYRSISPSRVKSTCRLPTIGGCTGEKLSV